MFSIASKFTPLADIAPSRRGFMLGAAALTGGLVVGYGAKAAEPAKE